MRGTVGVLFALAGFFGGPAVMPAWAQSTADFFKGKQIDLLIGYTAGGGYDVYARMIARYMGAHIPGGPTIVPKNKPGAGSLLVANEMYSLSPKDGTVLGTFGRGNFLEALWGNPAAKFDPTKLSWIGSANNEVSVCAFMTSAGISTTEQFLTKEIVVGGTGPGADTDLFPMVMNNVLGTHYRLITGYPGGNDINLAMERGEVQGRCGWSWSSVVATRPQWLKDKTIYIAGQIALNKHPELPNVPLVLDLAKNQHDRDVLEVVFSGQPMGRPYAAPPGLPSDRLQALRDAFDATMADKDFLAEADKAKLEITPVDGDAVQKIVDTVAAKPKDILQQAKDATTRVDRTRIEEIKKP
jgi:tripartite-type tricarboxylate transporter receptor subunit TctC